MSNLSEYMVNESSEFSKMENNPLIYTLIIPRIITTDDIKTIKEDKVLKAVVDVTEKFIKELPAKAINQLKKEFVPHTVIDIFKLSKNYKDTFYKYYADFKMVACHTESSFIKCIELDKKFDELLKCPEMITYLNTL